MTAAYRYIHEGFATREVTNGVDDHTLIMQIENPGRHVDLNDCNFDVEHDGTMIEISGRGTNT